MAKLKCNWRSGRLAGMPGGQGRRQYVVDDDATLGELAGGCSRAPGVPTGATVTSTLGSRCQLQTYQSLFELRALAGSLDVTPAPNLCVVLALHPHFAGRLASLLFRRHTAAELILTAAGEQFPSLCDWTEVVSGALGWQRVVVEPEWPVAVQATCRAMSRIDRVAILWPAWETGGGLSELRDLLNELDRMRLQ
jgi:hypothetical protein